MVAQGLGCHHREHSESPGHGHPQYIHAALHRQQNRHRLHHSIRQQTRQIPVRHQWRTRTNTPVLQETGCIFHVAGTLHVCGRKTGLARQYNNRYPGHLQNRGPRIRQEDIVPKGTHEIDNKKEETMMQNINTCDTQDMLLVFLATIAFCYAREKGAEEMWNISTFLLCYSGILAIMCLLSIILH